MESRNVAIYDAGSASFPRARILVGFIGPRNAAVHRVLPNRVGPGSASEPQPQRKWFFLLRMEDVMKKISVLAAAILGSCPARVSAQEEHSPIL